MSEDVGPRLDHPSTATVVRRAKRTWKRQGVPVGRRRAMAEELERHLLDAQADGRPLEDVTGPDVAGFAARWAQDHDALRWPLQALRLVGIYLATFGVLALVPVPFEGRTGFHPMVQAWLAFLALGVTVQVVYTARRARMTERQSVVLQGLLYLGLFIMLAISNILWPDPSAWWVTLPPGLVAAMILLGASLWALGWWRGQRSSGASRPRRTG